MREYGVPAFAGLCLFGIDTTTGIEPLQRIAIPTPEGYTDCLECAWYAGWTRGVFIGDYIYTVTPSSVQTLPVSDLQAQPARIGIANPD